MRAGYGVQPIRQEESRGPQESQALALQDVSGVVISLDRLLDGLCVAIEPNRTGCVERGIVVLSDGVTLRLSVRGIVVLPHRSHSATGGIRITYQGAVGIFEDLRTPLVEELSADDPIRSAFEEILEEMAHQRPGGRALLEALVRRWVILFLRRCCEHGHPPCWTAALEDERLGRVMTAMQERPHHGFTLSELSELAGMSRSVFAARFAEVVGRSPMEFLQALRLARAAELLVGTDLPVKSVATRVGYSSRSSFTRAFVARQGAGPTAFRAAAGAPLARVRAA